MLRTLVRNITVYFSNLKVMLKVELDINPEEKSAGTWLFGPWMQHTRQVPVQGSTWERCSDWPSMLKMDCLYVTDLQ